MEKGITCNAHLYFQFDTPQANSNSFILKAVYFVRLNYSSSVQNVIFLIMYHTTSELFLLHMQNVIKVNVQV